MPNMIRYPNELGETPGTGERSTNVSRIAALIASIAAYASSTLVNANGGCGCAPVPYIIVQLLLPSPLPAYILKITSYSTPPIQTFVNRLSYGGANSNTASVLHVDCGA